MYCFLLILLNQFHSESSPVIVSQFSSEIPDIDHYRSAIKYENEEGMAFLRVDGANRRMGPFDLSRHIHENVMAHYKPMIDRLVKYFFYQICTCESPSFILIKLILSIINLSFC